METINKLVQHHRSITSQFKLLHDSDSGRLSDGERVKARRERAVYWASTSNCGLRVEKTRRVYFVVWSTVDSSVPWPVCLQTTPCAAHHLRNQQHPVGLQHPGHNPHKLHIWLCILSYLLTLCQASVNKVKHSQSFVHVLQMNSNSALQDHRYCSIDIKCIQAAQWTETWRATETAGEEMLLPPGRSTL